MVLTTTGRETIWYESLNVKLYWFGYIAKNLDWMKLWIEQCEQHHGRLSWEGVATLIKRAHRNEDHNLTQREIDLAYGLKDKQVSI